MHEYKKIKYGFSGTPKEYCYYLEGDKKQTRLPETIITTAEVVKEIKKEIDRKLNKDGN